ncbi:hypothetical protein CEXT_541951 [Caerostris extrusa]|uniref:Uncharacterized protein n=1 Tax=Caerostris extrusa TaxID=172846 RepID=A0AAV4MHH5_CAEEX|nr:hypothetical protein CEXT_541951 [Caerostris extrusa]
MPQIPILKISRKTRIGDPETQKRSFETNIYFFAKHLYEPVDGFNSPWRHKGKDEKRGTEKGVAEKGNAGIEQTIDIRVLKESASRDLMLKKSMTDK